MHTTPKNATTMPKLRPPSSDWLSSRKCAGILYALNSAEVTLPAVNSKRIHSSHAEMKKITPPASPTI